MGQEGRQGGRQGVGGAKTKDRQKLITVVIHICNGTSNVAGNGSEEKTKRRRRAKEDGGEERDGGGAVVLSRRWMSSVGVTIVVCAAAAATLQLNLLQKAQSIWVIFVFKCRRTEA